MKNHLQDQFPYDSSILGLNGTYIDCGASFFINSDCILATDNTIAINKEYILSDYSTNTGIKIFDVFLRDCYFYEGSINLIVQDVRSQRVFTISQCLECPYNDCTWILLDIDYFDEQMDAKV